MQQTPPTATATDAATIRQTNTRRRRTRRRRRARRRARRVARRPHHHLRPPQTRTQSDRRGVIISPPPSPPLPSSLSLLLDNYLRLHYPSIHPSSLARSYSHSAQRRVRQGRSEGHAAAESDFGWDGAGKLLFLPDRNRTDERWDGMGKGQRDGHMRGDNNATVCSVWPRRSSAEDGSSFVSFRTLRCRGSFPPPLLRRTPRTTPL